MLSKDAPHFFDGETNTIYTASMDDIRNGVLVKSETEVEVNGRKKVMVLNIFVTIEAIHEAEFNESLPDGCKKNDPVNAGLRIGYLQLVSQVKAKLTEIGQYDITQDSRFKDEAIDRQIAKERKEREERVEKERKEREEREEKLHAQWEAEKAAEREAQRKIDDHLKSSDAWGTF